MRDMNFCSNSLTSVRPHTVKWAAMVMYFRTFKKVTTFSDFASFFKCRFTCIAQPSIIWVWVQPSSRLWNILLLKIEIFETPSILYTIVVPFKVDFQLKPFLKFSDQLRLLFYEKENIDFFEVLNDENMNETALSKMGKYVCK